MTTKDTTIRVRVDHELKHSVEHILSTLGLSTSAAITLFLNQVRLTKGLPFEVRIPNQVTLEAMREAENGILPSSKTPDDFFRELDE